jgi:arabinose-5-phosphate isomerase
MNLHFSLENNFRQCLLGEAAAIAGISDHINMAEVVKAIDLLSSCHERRAKLVVTGVGKSGIIARKIAATFSSIGLTSIYLNPLDAMHGDLGVVTSDDVALLLSNSGETQEVINVLSHLTLRKTVCIALVGKGASSIARCSDVVLEASVTREICPLNLAPTASTAAAMAIGDALAAVWMEHRGVSPADFAFNHPAGTLGKQLTLTVSDLMLPAERLQPLPASAPLLEVICHLTADGVGACWVGKSQAEDRIHGLITDGDLRRALQNHTADLWSQLTAADLMTVDPITVPASTLAIDAIKRMERNRRKAIGVLPVVDQEQRMLGLLRLHDLVQAGLA